MKTQGLPSGVWQQIPSATTGGETSGLRTNQMFLRMPEELDRRRVYRQQGHRRPSVGFETPCQSQAVHRNKLHLPRCLKDVGRTSPTRRPVGVENGSDMNCASKISATMVRRRMWWNWQAGVFRNRHPGREEGRICMSVRFSGRDGLSPSGLSAMASRIGCQA